MTCRASKSVLAPGSWTLTGSMTTAREGHQAVLLTSAEVLVAGGINASGTLASAELYDPSTGAWTATGSMITARSNFSLTLLPDGEVFVTGGFQSGKRAYSTAALYDPFNRPVYAGKRAVQLLGI